MRLTAIQLLPIRLPLVRPLRTAGGTQLAREGTAVRFETDVGFTGWGEASPYPGFGSETTASARRALAAEAPRWLGRRVDELEDALTRSELPASVRAALATARLDCVAQQRDVPLCDALVAGARQSVARVACNALLAESGLEALVAAARRHCDAGFETLKLKVGALSVERDRERVEAVREAVGPRAALRLDANQAWDLEAARVAAAAFAPFAIEYLEQPLPAADLSDLARLRRAIDVPLAVDEAALEIEGLRRAIAAEAADVVVVKPSAAGGPAAALEMAREARDAGVSPVVTTLFDSAVGVAAAIHAAAAIAAEGELRACGLGTGGHFELDLAKLAAPKDGAIEVPGGAGLGIADEPDPSRGWLAEPIIEVRA